jgi:hypothetical protein
MNVRFKDMRKVVEIALSAEGAELDKVSKDQLMALQACPKLLLSCLDKIDSIKAELSDIVAPEYDVIDLSTSTKKSEQPSSESSTPHQNHLGSNLSH